MQRVENAIRFLVMLGVCSFSVPVLHKAFLEPVLMYGNETMLWKDKKRSRIMAIQMDNVKGLLSIKRIDRVPNAQIREMCRVMKGFSNGLVT